MGLWITLPVLEIWFYYFWRFWGTICPTLHHFRSEIPSKGFLFGLGEPLSFILVHRNYQRTSLSTLFFNPTCPIWLLVPMFESIISLPLVSRATLFLYKISSPFNSSKLDKLKGNYGNGHRIWRSFWNQRPWEVYLKTSVSPGRIRPS